MAQKKIEIEKPVQMINKDSLNLYFVDTFKVAVRSDDIVLMNFYSQLPEGIAQEQARLVTTSKGAAKFIELLCKLTGYYPDKAPEVKPKK